MCILADDALAQTPRVLGDLRLHPERMAANTQTLDGLMLSEAVMFALGKYVQALLDSAHYTGLAAIMTDQVLAKVGRA